MNRDMVQEALGRILEMLENAEVPTGPGSTRADRSALLTARQVEVLRCAARGGSVAETARQLHMSVSTVKNHRQAILARLRVPNLPAAVFEASVRGLLP